MNEDSFTYIGVAPCGCVRIATLDDGTCLEEMAKDLAKMARSGYTVRRIPTSEVRFHKCETHQRERFPAKKKAPRPPKHGALTATTRSGKPLFGETR